MRVPDQVIRLLDEFIVSNDFLSHMVTQMQEEFKLGLEFGKTATSSIAMLPSFVPRLPTGDEKGKYVAIDLSGKNLRVVLLKLNGRDDNPDSVTTNYIVSEAVMKGTGEQLFNFIVTCLHKFLEQQGISAESIALGFVFSYPCELLSIRSARLMWWTKGFDISDCLHKDVVRLLENAIILNMTIKARVKAVMNDTVGQLAAAAYKHGPDCRMAVVVGYGCNSSYVERVSKIAKFKQHSKYPHDEMIVVTEWEEFGDRGELDAILTSFDKEVDASSVHRGKQRIDKLTGALYLGELVRLICAQLVADDLLFGGQMPPQLQFNDGFPCKYINEILRDEDSTFKNCRRIMEEMEIEYHGVQDYAILKYICHIVSQRSAHLVAAAISALLAHMGRPEIKVGIGGALVQFHPTYMKLLTDKLVQLAPSNVKWQLVEAHEGSVRGAALIAAVAEADNL